MTEYRHHGNVDLCDDCETEKPTVTYGLGTVRCEACSQHFQYLLEIKRSVAANKEREALAKHQSAGCPDDGTPCPRCCEHDFDPDEGYMCLNCGAEGFEDVMSAYECMKDGE